MMVHPSELKFDEDLFFVKGKTSIILNLIKFIEEKEPSIPVINPFKGIFNAIHRFMNSVLLEKAGVRVPQFSLNPCQIPSKFDDYIIKNIIDQKVYAFTPQIEKEGGHIHVSDKRALNEISNCKENYEYLYYQEFLKSKWEYKVYGFGDQLRFYKQLPVLVNPNKMESRSKINEIPELREMALKAMDALDLKVVSIDFLKDNDKFYLTDINSTPNFNYVKNGPQIISDYLIKAAKRGGD